MTVFLGSLIDFMINFVNAHMPSYDFESGTYIKISSALDFVVNFLADVNFIVPLGDISVIIILTLGIRVFKFTLFAGNWIIRRVCDILP